MTETTRKKSKRKRLAELLLCRQTSEAVGIIISIFERYRESGYVVLRRERGPMDRLRRWNRVEAEKLAGRRRRNKTTTGQPLSSPGNTLVWDQESNIYLEGRR